MTDKNEPDLFATACMIINSIDPNAGADPDTMLRSRVTTSHVIVITCRGQKFSIPMGTVQAAAEATADAQPHPTTTIKATAAQPAKTIKAQPLPAKTTTPSRRLGKRTTRK